MRTFWLRFAALCMVLWFGLRAALALSLPAQSAGDRLVGMGLGFGSDLQALALLGGLLAVGFLLTGRRFAVLWLVLAVAFFALMFATDALYWVEFQTRVGRVALHYIVYFREVVQFAHEQIHLAYYVPPALALAWLAARWMARWLPSTFTPAHRLGFLGWLAAAALVLAFGQAWPTGHSRPLNQLASNGYLEMLFAARVDLAAWDGVYWSCGTAGETAADGGAPCAADDGLEAMKGAAAGAGASASHSQDLGGVPAPNLGAGEFRHLLLVIEESMGGENWRDPQRRRKYMPQLAALAQRGLYFDSVYATGSRTIRGLEAILNGYPPLPGKALSQRQGFERAPSLPRVLGNAGFHTVFVYAGWPNFTNFFNYWRGIGFQEMLQRKDFAERKAELVMRQEQEGCEDCWFETSWGAADEFLFERVLTEMDRLTALHERVLLATLTLSNHLPFDFPDGRINFPSDERRQEYVIAYADWALGEFIRQVDERPWLEDTLVVVVADHGPDVPGSALVPADNFRVPLVVYNPVRLAPQVIAHHGSTMSLAVTLLELLGVPATEPLYGGNLMRGELPLAPVEEDYHVGVLGPRHLTVLARDGALYGWRYAGGRLLLDQPDMQQAQQAAALFGDAHRRFYGG